MFSRQLGNRLLLRPFTTHKLPPPLKNAASIPQGEREAPEPLPEAAHDIWTREQQGLEYKPPKGKETDWFHHPLYSPPADPETGIGPMIAPLKWPEFDQKVLSAQESGFANNWTKYEFDSPTAPIGNYPRDIPLQWTQLKDPFKVSVLLKGTVLGSARKEKLWRRTCRSRSIYRLAVAGTRSFMEETLCKSCGFVGTVCPHGPRRICLGSCFT